MTGDDQRWQEVPDRELVDRARHPANPAERAAALTQIYQRYELAVVRSCVRYFSDMDSVRHVAAAAFEAAIRELSDGPNPPREPDKLKAWLRAIAKNRCREELRRRGDDVPLPDFDLEDADFEQASRRRLAQVDRMLEAVAASFTEREQRVFELSTRQGLRGQELAAVLGVSATQADRETYENKTRAAQGFGAYILAREGRPYCPKLARILDEYAWDGQTLTRVLRLRILRHLETCKTCDNCATCKNRQARLIVPYSPVLIPMLVIPDVREHVLATIRRVSTEEHLPDDTDRHPPPGAAPILSHAAGEHQEPPSRRRRWAGPAAVAVVFLVILGAFMAPRLLPTPTGSEFPVDLAGALGDWQLPQWTRTAGPPRAASSQWALDENCSSPSSCSYTLRVISSDHGPDILYTPELASATVFEGEPPRVLRFQPSSEGYRAVHTYPMDCGDDVDTQPEQFTDTVTLRVTATTLINGRLTASELEVTWMVESTPSASARAIGCTPRLLIDKAIATRSR